MPSDATLQGGDSGEVKRFGEWQRQDSHLHGAVFCLPATHKFGNCGQINIGS